MMNQIKTWNEMVKGINETAAKNIETTKQIITGRIERADQMIASGATNAFTCAIANANQINNNCLTYFASTMNNISNAWHSGMKEREGIKKSVIENIENACQTMTRTTENIATQKETVK